MRLPRGAQYPAQAFVVAQLDFLEAGARGIRFTPTFAFWRKGRKATPCCRSVYWCCEGSPHCMRVKHAAAVLPGAGSTKEVTDSS
jgi:hypothetical protein